MFVCLGLFLVCFFVVCFLFFVFRFLHSKCDKGSGLCIGPLPVYFCGHYSFGPCTSQLINLICNMLGNMLNELAEAIRRWTEKKAWGMRDAGWPLLHARRHLFELHMTWSFSCLPALPDCRWRFESLLVHSEVSSATCRKATGADHEKMLECLKCSPFLTWHSSYVHSETY